MKALNQNLQYPKPNTKSETGENVGMEAKVKDYEHSKVNMR